MAKYTPEDIKRLANAMRRARDDKRPFNMLTGAGCSLTAGIPLAPKLVEEIHEKYGEECRHRLDEGLLNDYGACMECLSDNERGDLLKPYLDNAKINWAHIVIASLMDAGFIAKVLTFNFDSILAQSCGLVGLYPATYDFAAASSKVTDYLATPSIIHLHGQGYALKMLNGAEETKTHAENLRPLMRNSLREAPLLVLGYSGLSDSVFPVIKEEYNGYDRLCWAGFSTEPTESIRKLIQKGGQTAEYLGNSDADNFLIDIARELDCWPELFNDPYGHLLDELKPVLDFPMGDGGGSDLLSNVRKKLKVVRAADAEDTSEDLEDLMRQGEWEKVIEQGNRDNIDEKELVAWAYFMQGSELLKSARQSQDEGLYTESIEKYSKAIEINPDDDVAYCNLGLALSELAKIKDDEGLYTESIEKYSKAAEINPDNDTTYCNWGLALSAFGKLKDDEGLYTESIEKYSKAIEINPNDQIAYVGWGSTLSNLAKLKDDEGLYTESIEKYAKAIEVNPDNITAYSNWGTVLLALARNRDDDKLIDEARVKLETAEKINSDKVYNLACVLARLGEEEKCKEKLFHCKEKNTLPSKEHLLEDVDLENVRELNWFKDLIADME